MTDTYWQGERLPTARPGNVWLLQIYPGGRMQIVQCDPKFATSVDLAVGDLLAGGSVRVALDDAEETVRQWNERKAVTA